MHVHVLVLVVVLTLVLAHVLLVHVDNINVIAFLNERHKKVVCVKLVLVLLGWLSWLFQSRIIFLALIQLFLFPFGLYLLQLLNLYIYLYLSPSSSSSVHRLLHSTICYQAINTLFLSHSVTCNSIEWRLQYYRIKHHSHSLYLLLKLFSMLFEAIFSVLFSVLFEAIFSIKQTRLNNIFFSCLFCTFFRMFDR